MAETLDQKIKQDKAQNPASLSMDPNKKVQRNKPHVKPPFKDVPMTKFLTYLSFGLVALIAFYIWRLTVWASDAGGYWNLATGRTAPVAAAEDAADLAKLAAESAVSQRAAGTDTAKSSSTGEPEKESIESQVERLANALGISPADLTAAIRPYLDPTVPNPNAAGGQLGDAAAAAAAASAAAAEAKEQQESPGLLGVVGEMVFD